MVRYRQLLALTAAGALIVGGSACGNDDAVAEPDNTEAEPDDTEAEPDDTEAEPAISGDGASSGEDGASPDLDGTMYLAAGIRPTQWDPHLGNSAVVDYSLMGPVYDRFLVLEPDMTVGPMLASAFELSNNNHTLTLELREDVAFHDGSLFDADVAKANLDRAQGLGSRWSPLLDIVDDVVVVDEYTIRLDLNDDGVNFPLTLAMNPGIGAVISPLGLDNPDALATQPAGSGQFRLVNQREDSAVYERNDDYWDRDLLNRTPARLEIFGYDDADARVNGVRTGQFHGAMNVEPLTNPEAVVDNEEVFLHVVEETNRAQQVVLNYSHPALGDPNIRRALSLGIDREALVEAVYGDDAIPTMTQFAPGTFGYNPDVELTYDLEEARRLVEESAITDMSFRLQTYGASDANAIATILQQQWGELGFDIEVVILESALALAAFSDGENEAYVAIGAGFPDPYTALERSLVNLPGGADQTLLAMNQAAGRLPLGSPEREAAYQEISAYIAENAPSIPIAIVPPSAVHRSTLHGLDDLALGKLQTAWDPRYLWISGPPSG